MVGGHDHRPLGGDVLPPDPAEAEVDVEERLQHAAEQPVDEWVGSVVPQPPVQYFVIHRTLAYPFRRWPLQLAVLSPTVDRTRTLRGAVCGAVAASVWALQQPLDKRAFAAATTTSSCSAGRCRGATTAAGIRSGWQCTSRTAPCSGPFTPTLPRAAAAGGGARAGVGAGRARCALASDRVTDRFHPARKRTADVEREPQRVRQAAWRHLVFGCVLGELDRRLSPPPESEAAEPEADFSSNGHGSLEHAMSAETTERSGRAGLDHRGVRLRWRLI